VIPLLYWSIDALFAGVLILAAGLRGIELLGLAGPVTSRRNYHDLSAELTDHKRSSCQFSVAPDFGRRWVNCECKHVAAARPCS